MKPILKIKTAKNKDGIEIDKYRYRKDHTLASGEISWRCTNRKCSSSLKTNHAITTVTSKPSSHNHKPPENDVSVPSSPSISEPSTPTSETSSQQTPTWPTTDSKSTSTEEAASLEEQPPSLTELLSPYVTLTPDPPKFQKLEEENAYLRQRIAELTYTNESLTDRLILLEEDAIKLKKKIEEQTSESVQKVSQEKDHQCIPTEKADFCEPEKGKKLNKQPLSVSVSIQTEKYPVDSLNGVRVLEADMRDVIDELKTRKDIAFSHTISGDFDHPRRMSAGVAVTFRDSFGKPERKDCVTKHLACQRTSGGATVYSLITKKNYYGKPIKENYDTAFEDLTQDFKKGDFTTLICSPMGCVRDLVKLDHFARNIVKFHRSTGAPVLIVTQDQAARRVLRHGLSHPEFMKELRCEIRRAQQIQHPKTDAGVSKEDRRINKKAETNTWYKLPDEDIKLYLDNISIPENTLLLDPTISHLLRKNENVEDVFETKAYTDIDSYEYVLAPVNDRTTDEREGGAHWSLLLYARETNTYFHLDSLEPHNKKYAEQLAAKLSGDPCVSVVQVKCRRQTSSVECGAYMLQYCDTICSLIKNKLSVQDDRCYNQPFSVNKVYSAIQNIKESKTPKQKVVVLSDSHGRGLRQLLGRKFAKKEVYSVIKPNATLEVVTSGLDNETSKLGSNDHLVILGGCNNMNFEKDFDVKQAVKEIATKTRNTNVLLCTIPLRYDKPDLNVKIRKTNINLVIEALKYDHVKIVSLSNVPVQKYNRLGLHLNYSGKKLLCSLLESKMRESNSNLN